MSDISHDDSASIDEETPQVDHLPPVEPPSARFIIQLFLVPALIVMAVVGVWLLFGMLAAGEEDWRKQLTELRSENLHRRWRGANALAHLLQSDQRRGADGEQLSQNRKIATELSELLKQELTRSSRNEDDLKRVSFLVLTLKMSDIHDITLPVLQQSVQANQDPEIRKNAMRSIIEIAARAHERGQPLDDESLINDVIEVSRDSEPLFRQLGAYALPFLPSESAKHQLAVLLEDADPNTRLNAAIGMARLGSTRGLAVFHTILSDAPNVDLTVASSIQRTQQQSSETKANKQYETLVALKNTLEAISRLQEQLTDDQRSELIALLEPIAADFGEPGIRLNAKRLLKDLQQ